MLSSLFGLLSALTWGAGDFTGGIVSRRAGSYRAAFYGEFTGLFFLLAMLAVAREPLPAGPAWAWSASAGAIGSVGLLLLFRSLADGQMSIAAPVSALLGAVMPVVASILTEGLPGVEKYIGFGLALVAIWLISQGEGHQKKLHLHLADLRLPLLAGVCFGAYFILMHQGSRTATIWPMVFSRSAGSIVLFCFAAANRQLQWPGKKVAPLVFLNAAGDIAGNTFYILAGQAGRLDVAAVLGSLYPGTTVLLAGLLLHERLNRSQWIGILAALAAIALMTV
ncbi:MAG TPA: DMT family transporter [Anaerolineales bacterium]|nr:DMT family transporter [Anaerolineales bacterium]